MESLVVRRRATQQELEQGVKEMEDAQKRMEAENRIRGEEPIEDQRSPDGAIIEGSQETEVGKRDEGIDRSSPNPASGQSRPAVHVPPLHRFYFCPKELGRIMHGTQQSLAKMACSCGMVWYVSVLFLICCCFGPMSRISKHKKNKKR